MTLWRRVWLYDAIMPPALYDGIRSLYRHTRHSARHAGIAFRKGGAATAIALGYQTAPWCDEAVMAHARMSAHTYVTHYLRTIRAAALDDGSA